ncbi:MAG: hypothetical protein JNK72_22530 [Myxococcales bacterium]|nr:hypothetical protein [Myxococcales bacterium]
MQRRSLGGGAFFALGLSAVSFLAHGQPAPAGAGLPEQAAVARWLERACGLGQAADATWATAHLRVPMRTRDRNGETSARYRRGRITTAADAIDRACPGSPFEELRTHRSATWFADLVEQGGAFDVVERQRRLRFTVGQFGQSLLFVTAPDGEAMLVGIRDE